MTRRLLTNVVVALFLGATLGATQSSSPLADAAMRGDKDAVKKLLKEGADVGVAQGDGMTALHWAAERGDAELAQILLVAGANASAVTRIGLYTPLHLAAKAASVDVVKALIAGGADVNARNAAGQTALELVESMKPRVLDPIAEMIGIFDDGASPAETAAYLRKLLAAR